MKLQTFTFKHHPNTIFQWFHISLTPPLELETAHALFPSLEIYKGTSPVCTGNLVLFSYNINFHKKLNLFKMPLWVHFKLLPTSILFSNLKVISNICGENIQQDSPTFQDKTVKTVN